MAGEIHIQHPSNTTAVTCYAMLRNAIGQVCTVSSGAFGAYATASIANYKITLTEQGTASRFYAGNVPGSVAAGDYTAVFFQGAGAEGDTLLGFQDVPWDGSAVVSIHPVKYLPSVTAGEAGGVFIAGTNAPVVITGSGTALQIESTGGNGRGLYVIGNGTGDGILASGGATGNGIYASGGGTSGDGIYGTSIAGNGHGFRGKGQGTGDGMFVEGGAEGDGIHAMGGATSGYGIDAYGQTNSAGIYAGGAGTGAGIQAAAGATGIGIYASGGATSGNGIYGTALGGNSNGIVGSGNGSGSGVVGQSGATGHGLLGIGGATSGHGIRAYAATSGAGIHARGTGSGDDIDAPDSIWDQSTTIAAYLDTEVAAIKAKTDNLPTDPADASDIATAFGTVNSTLSTIAGYIDTEVGAIKTVTDAIGATGSGLSAIPWNAAWDTEVQSECADALAAYDGPTNAEMEARTLVAANYFDPAVDVVAHVTLVDTCTTNTDMVSVPTANQNAAALLDLTDGVETGLTPRQALRLISAALAGKLSGAATTTITIRNTADSKDRITATVTSDGDRTSVSYDVS